MLKFWVIVDEFERAVVLTLGKRRLRKKRWHFWLRKDVELGPGFHFIWPIRIDDVMWDNVVPTDLQDLEVNMTLKCGTPLHVTFSALWTITDIKKYKLEIEDADSVLLNVSGMVQEYLFQYTWDELMSLRREGIGDRRQSLPWKLTTHCNRETRQWGAELTRLYLQDFIRTDLRQGVVKILGRGTSEE